MTDDLQARRVRAVALVIADYVGDSQSWRDDLTCAQKALAAADAVTAEPDQPQKPPRKAREAR